MIIFGLELIPVFWNVGLKNTYVLKATGRFLQITGWTFSIFEESFFCMEKIGRRNKK
jgi:hypothetical protein